MAKSTRAFLLGFSVLSASVGLSMPVFAQDATTEAPSGDEEIVVTGTRVANRSRLDTIAPVDVVTSETLTNSGTSELNQALATTLPSFNFPRPGLADGTDTIRPATLRGLAPDQTLVLVNSKRRHASSLVNINGTVGRGSAAVDMNTIPTGAISSIEVLRDGASAQYGSDAIAGVFNVRLREASQGGNVTVSYGQRNTTVESNGPLPPAGATWTVNRKRDVTDGATMTVSGWVGLPFIGEDGYLTVSGEYKDAEKTVRASEDGRQQYALVGSAFDPRENSFKRLNSWRGDPELEQFTLFANGGFSLGGSANAYGWASYQTREAVSAGFYRRSLDARNVVAIYPDGFLPKINPTADDMSVGGGVEFVAGGWDLDGSLVYGNNRIEYTIRDTLNASFGAASKRVFDAGALEYDQLVGNISAVRQVEMSALASPLNVAMGLEARREGYRIDAGEPQSYLNGGVLLPSGARAASGSQVFPGFQPSNEVDEDRTAVGAYIDLEANLTEKLLVSGALRAESYSDFGESVTGKIAGRYDFSDGFAIRGAVSTGFRAPGLQQSFFTATSTNFISGVPFDIVTTPAESAIARTLGAKPLDAEESTNYSLGLVARSGPFNLTVDAYFIEVTDRIVLTENLTQANVLALLPPGIGGVRFFQNGVDTETAGVDIVASYKVSTDTVGDFDFTAGLNFNNTVITRLPSINTLSALTPPPVLFARVNSLVLEKGQPKEKASFATVWSNGALGATARLTYYGSVVEPGTTPANDISLGQKSIFDVEGRVNLGESVQFALGAENLFDQYPDANPATLNTTGSTSFSNFSPFGYNGRYVYARASFSW